MASQRHHGRAGRAQRRPYADLPQTRHLERSGGGMAPLMFWARVCAMNSIVGRGDKGIHGGKPTGGEPVPKRRKSSGSDTGQCVASAATASSPMDPSDVQRVLSGTLSKQSLYHRRGPDDRLVLGVCLSMSW